MDKERRAFQGVFMPRCIWLNNELKPSEKMLLTEINSLDTQKECFASNDHFTTFLNVSKGRVSQMISHLRNLGYINVRITYKQDSKQIDKRVITVNQQKFYGTTPLEKGDTPLADYLPPLGNAQDNISFNKSINKTVADSKESASDKNQTSKKQLDEDFEKLWKLYPRKTDKQTARKKYIKAIKDGTTNKEIQDGIVGYLKQIKVLGTPLNYVKGGGTWFSKHAWEDEYETGSEQRGSNPKDSSSQDKMVSLKAKIKKEAEKKIKENKKENAARRTRIMQGSAEQA